MLMMSWNFRLLGLICLFGLISCQHPASLDDLDEDDGNVMLMFSADDATRTGLGDYFSKLNVMLFNEDGEKAFSKVKTQVMSDEGFGTMSLTLSPGIYTVVAVGHSSAKSATIKSPTDVRFTATDGEKLTDTFAVCEKIEVSEDATEHSLPMQRATAMFRLVMTDEQIPATATHIKFDYTGGSANFNPTTLEGITRSTQSEVRTVVSPPEYEIFTFPYYSTDGLLKVTATALAADGSVLAQQVFEGVEVTRNMITTYRGPFFSGGNLTQEGVGFHIDDDWAGETVVEY